MQCAPCGRSTLTNQSYERWPSTALWCVLTGLGNIWYSEEDIQAAKQEFPKTWLAIMCDCILCCNMGLLRSLLLCRHFCRDAGPEGPFFTLTLFCCCRANIIGSCVTQPKIARIISIVSGVLWWQYATYASPRIMTKASSGYHMQCAHFVRHILEGVWLLALPKADWGKVFPERLRVCPWTVFSFIHLGCCPRICQWWDKV
jgi:hypothetical protein